MSLVRKNRIKLIESNCNRKEKYKTFNYFIGSEIDDPYIGKIFIERYEIKKQLGKGSYGNVYLVFDLEVKQK